LKKFNDLIGNRNRDLPTCSIMHQPTTLPRAPSIRLTQGRYVAFEPLNEFRLNFAFLVPTLKDTGFLYIRFTVLHYRPVKPLFSRLLSFLPCFRFIPSLFIASLPSSRLLFSLLCSHFDFSHLHSPLLVSSLLSPCLFSSLSFVLFLLFP
jgi:hypothetical protein